MNTYGIGKIEEGKFKGKKFLIPSEVWVEKGTFAGGAPQFAKACLKHEIWVPDNGCPICKKENKEVK